SQGGRLPAASRCEVPALPTALTTCVGRASSSTGVTGAASGNALGGRAASLVEREPAPLRLVLQNLRQHPARGADVLAMAGVLELAQGLVAGIDTEALGALDPPESVIGVAGRGNHVIDHDGERG